MNAWAVTRLVVVEVMDHATGRQEDFHRWYEYLTRTNKHFRSACIRVQQTIIEDRPHEEHVDALLDAILLYYRPDDEYGAAMNPEPKIIPMIPPEGG